VKVPTGVKKPTMAILQMNNPFLRPHTAQMPVSGFGVFVYDDVEPKTPDENGKHLMP